MTYEYTDEWGLHQHEIEGAPYDHKKKVTCTSCIARLSSVLSGWEETLTLRHGLPPKFWDGYKHTSWE